MKPRKISPERIPALLARGLSAAEIASELGCTEGSLRVRCSHFKISLRRVSPQGARRGAATGRPAVSRANRSLDIPLPADTIDQLRRRGAAMGVSAAVLAASLLETVSRDCLYSAVLDAD
jgi:hypothetical protein